MLHFWNIKQYFQFRFVINIYIYFSMNTHSKVIIFWNYHIEFVRGNSAFGIMCINGFVQVKNLTEIF